MHLIYVDQSITFFSLKALPFCRFGYTVTLFEYLIWVFIDNFLITQLINSNKCFNSKIIILVRIIIY